MLKVGRDLGVIKVKWKAKSKSFRTSQAMGECLKLVFTEAFCQQMSNVSLLFSFGLKELQTGQYLWKLL